jgi:hypothetical protein
MSATLVDYQVQILLNWASSSDLPGAYPAFILPTLLLLSTPSLPAAQRRWMWWLLQANKGL